MDTGGFFEPGFVDFEVDELSSESSPLPSEIARSPAPPPELGLTELSFQHRSLFPQRRPSSSQKLPSNGAEKPKSGGKAPDLSFVLKEKAHTYVSACCIS